MICYIAMTLLGAALVVFGRKKSKIVLIAGAVLAAVGLFLVICTAILAYSVSHSEPNPKFENINDTSYETDGGEVYHEV